MICDIHGAPRNLPDFLIVGAAKSGTTSLHNYLARHPDVFMPRGKELLFFHIATNPNCSQLQFSPQAATDFDSYLAAFDAANAEQICGESCPSYLYYHEHTITNIKRFHPCWCELKIVIILREPVDKIVSHYFFVKHVLGRISPELAVETIEESLAAEPSRRDDPEALADLLYVDNTRYASQVRAYLEAFANVRVFLYEELRDRPAELFASLCEFLGIRADVDCGVGERHNQRVRCRVPRGIAGRVVAGLAKTPLTMPIRAALPSDLKAALWSAATMELDEGISDETRDRLKEIFRPEVRELEQLLRRDLKCWAQ